MTKWRSGVDRPKNKREKRKDDKVAKWRGGTKIREKKGRMTKWQSGVKGPKKERKREG